MSLLWPESCADCRVSHRFKPSHKVLRTEMDDGTVKTRLAVTKSRKLFSAELEFTGTQLATFEAFLEDGARVLPFEWEHPVSGAAVLCRFTKTEFDWPLQVGGATAALSIYRGSVECEILGAVA